MRTFAGAAAALSLLNIAAPAAAAPAPAPVHAYTPFDDLDLLASSAEKRDLDRRFTSNGGMRVGFQQKRGSEYGRTVKRFAKRQGSTPADDSADLLNYLDIRYIATINIAGQDLDVILDTGSTDTFVYSVQPDPLAGLPASQLPPLFDNTTREGLYETDLIYEAQYGAGNGVTSTLGTVMLADCFLNGTDLGDGTPLTVTNLSFAALYQSTAATGASGLLGLGFPLNGIVWLEAITRYYNQTGQALSLNESAEYWPIVPLLFHEERIPRNLFSVEVDRNNETVVPTAATQFDYTEGGTLTLGDFPEGLGESDFSWSPVPVVEFNEVGQARGLPVATGNRWTTPLEAIYFNGRRLDDTLQQTDNEDGYFVLIDTGNPSTALPSDVLSQITNAFAANPDNLVVPCDSPFELIFQIGGTNFTMASEDFLVPSVEALDSLQFGGFSTQGCQLQAQPNSPTPNEIGPGTSISYLFGAPFLRSVYSVFDYGDLTNSLATPPRIGLRSRVQ